MQAQTQKHEIHMMNIASAGGIRLREKNRKINTKQKPYR
jgi:hypothetical protein